jgi:hypothetical protein
VSQPFTCEERVNMVWFDRDIHLSGGESVDAIFIRRERVVANERQWS